MIFVSNQGDKVPQEAYQRSRQSVEETSHSESTPYITRDQTEMSTTKSFPVQRHPAQMNPHLTKAVDQPVQLSPHHTATHSPPDSAVQSSPTRPHPRQTTLLPHTESDEEFLYCSESMECEPSQPPLRLESPSSSQHSNKGAESPRVEPHPNIPVEDKDNVSVSMTSIIR